jgi:hypothetical protein
MAEQVEYKSFSELDYQNIKELLKNHLKTQDILKDFNFEGSTINVILNLLAYNNQYMAYYLNMLASEKFIATAQKRESVVGLANNNGYVPYSRKSSTALLSFIIQPDIGYTDSIIIPKNVKFTTSIDGISYNFLTTQNTTIIPVDGVYTVSNLEVKEGRFFTHKFTISPTDKFLTIPNVGLDYNRLTLRVRESASSSNEIIYSKYTTLVDLTPNSTVYFLQETSGGLYQLYFGDGILSKSLSVGNVATVEYYITTGALANNASEFVLDDEVTGLTSITFTSISKSSGGASEESTDSVRISAPTNYQAQNRAITPSDYDVLIKQIYPDAKQVSTLGGETANPPQYGKVLISILKNDLNVLSDKDKNSIILELDQRYSGLTVFPIIVDPYIIRMYIQSKIKYKNTGVSEAEIKSAVFSTIHNFAESDLNSFKFILRKSRFESMIDDSHPSILSNSTDFKLYIDTNDSIIPYQSNQINFSQPIVSKSLSSSTFTYKTISNCQFIDVDGNGFASIYIKSITGDLAIVQKNALSINYNSGLIKYVDNTYSFQRVSLENSSGIKISVDTVSEDIVANNLSVIYVNDDDISISTVVEF